MDTLTWIYIALVILFVLIFLLRQLMQKWLIWGARGIFVISLVGALASVAFPGLFYRLSASTLQKNGVLESLQTVDGQLSFETVVTPAKDLYERIKNFWQPSPSVSAAPQQHNSNQRGIMEEKIYPGLVTLLAKTYRGGTMAISLLGLVLSVYMNFLFGSVSELEKLKKKYDQMEKKVNTL